MVCTAVHCGAAIAAAAAGPPARGRAAAGLLLASHLPTFSRGRVLQAARQPSRAELRCTAGASDDSFVSSSSSGGGDEPHGAPVAGIPVDSSAADVELWRCLRDRPAEFAIAAVAALRALEASADRGQQEDTEGRPPAAGAAEAAAETGTGAAAAGEPGSQGQQRPCPSLSGVIYMWALAEAYCMHPLVQEPMRALLGRSGEAPLAAGDGERQQLAGEARLLWGSQGQYQVGSVRFASGSQSSGLPTGGRFGVLGPLSLGAGAEEPRPISRAAAARAYCMYSSWGYFNRHMALRRQAEEAVLGPGGPAERAWLPSVGPGAQGSRAETPYGEVTKVWRFFENVPDELCKMRTSEAAAAADTHVRALFGAERECITTMARWRHMTHEAMWWGRALYDAEQLALQHAPGRATGTWC